MFSQYMSLSEMDNIISTKERENAITLQELVKMMSNSDLKAYIEACKLEKLATDKSFAYIEQVGYNAFYIASELQLRY